MLPDLPVFAPKTKHFLSGKFLTRLCDRVLRQTPKAGAGVDLEYTRNGIACHAKGAVGAPGSMIYGFQVSWKTEGSEVSVAPGIVAGPDWTAWDDGDPTPTDWLAEIEVAGTDLAVSSGDSVWLHVTVPVTQPTLLGQLYGADATEYEVTSGGGGGGGQGGGGGAGGEFAEDGTAGLDGTDAVGETAGTGATNATNGGASPGEGDGTPGKGGTGGDGGAGGAGEAVFFDHYQNLRLRQRRYNLYTAELIVDAGTPANTHTDIHIRVATVSGSTITQYHAGSYLVIPSVIGYIPA